MLIADTVDLFLSILLDFSSYDFLLCCFAVMVFVFITALVIVVIKLKGGFSL